MKAQMYDAIIEACNTCTSFSSVETKRHLIGFFPVPQDTGKVISEWIHPHHTRKPNKAAKVDKRTWKQRLQFSVFCTPVVDKFWRV